MVYLFVFRVFSPARIMFVLYIHDCSTAFFSVSHWHALKLFLFGIGFIVRGVTLQRLIYHIMNFKSCERCVLICFYQRQLWFKCHFARFIFLPWGAHHAMRADGKDIFGILKSLRLLHEVILTQWGQELLSPILPIE